MALALASPLSETSHSEYVLIEHLPGPGGAFMNETDTILGFGKQNLLGETDIEETITGGLDKG